ncbi:hypothetical protein PAECIP111893_03416 [Paenibacillus plantiphilus]|uniref:DUF5325 family protein n=1 Tax=Paenibacillus plantiphilus TaxID=2905650 RepID=A0ABM9CE20_9BACL|nr:hypothetical protein [Paenibacillus plantiphilus]CAH1211498.1 hypothetical protein PAECIP111893_03416 [Paenibacillus plantiphilus]
MSKPMAMGFALFSVLLMILTGVFISINGWLAALFFVLTIAFIVFGFIVSAKLRRRNQTQ